MYYNTDALLFLEKTAGDEETSRSSFWEAELENFSFSAAGDMDGLICIGSLSKKTNWLNHCAHWLLQLPYRYNARNCKNLRKIVATGRTVAARQGRVFTYDMMRQTLALATAMDHYDLAKSNGHNLVIGDGYGVMTSLLKLTFPAKKLIIINLTTPLLIDIFYLKKVIPGCNVALPEHKKDMETALTDAEVDVIALRGDQAEFISQGHIGFAFNVHSMQEMNNEIIELYFRLLRGNKNKETAFYCCNRIYKRLYDNEEVKFLDYPWREDEEVLLDEICPWDNFEYDRKPPFWYRNKNQKMHRIAIMKNQSD